VNNFPTSYAKTKDNIKIALKETRRVVADWNNTTQNSVHYRDPLNTEINFPSTYNSWTS